jgi:hypothetical protein
MPVPNPNPTGISFKLAGPTDVVELRIYSRAMVCLGLLRLDHCVVGWQTIDLRATGFIPSASGLYYYSLTSQRDGQKAQVSKPGFLLWLR